MSFREPASKAIRTLMGIFDREDISSREKSLRCRSSFKALQKTLPSIEPLYEMKMACQLVFLMNQ
jgi:hypothetical protein